MENQEYINQGKGIAWLSYLGILVIIPILVQKDNPYTKFHIRQGIGLLIASIIWTIASYILAFIPFIGWLVDMAGWIALLVFMIMGIVNALQGKQQELPIVGSLAAKINF